MNKEYDVRLIALDLDGTCLDSKKEMSERTICAIEAACKKGIEVVIASGRSRNGVMEVISTLPNIRYMITSCGACAIDLTDDSQLYNACIQSDRAAVLLDKLLTIGVMADVYYGGGALSDLRNYNRIIGSPEGFPAWFIEYFVRNRKPVEDLPGMLRAGRLPDVEKITASFEDMSLRERAFSLMKGESGLSIVAGNPFNMEISHENATKGKALTALTVALGIDMGQVMACGDSGNDLSMIEAAGLGVAMANADAECIAVADFVTKDNDHDGVALAIERFALI